MTNDPKLPSERAINAAYDFARTGSIKGSDGITRLIQVFASFEQDILQSSGAVEALREALDPVMHWYQSDEENDRPLVDIVADVVADLQHDRAQALLVSRLHHAGANLSICAQTTGGVAGPDAGLMLAIRQWNEADAPVREDIRAQASAALTKSGDARD